MAGVADYWVWLDGAVGSADSARVSVMDHGFLYGDTVYESLRTYGGRFLALPEHLSRLENSAAALDLEIPGGRGAVVEALTACAAYAPPGVEVGVRVTVSRGVGPLGLDTALCTQPRLVVVAWSIAPGPHPLAATGVRLIVTRTRRNAPDSLDPHIKSGNLLNNLVAYREVKRAGAFEGVLLTHHGHVAECTTSNVFWVNDGAVKTPVDEGILLGVTRATVIELLTQHDVPLRRVAAWPDELIAADEVFITSSLKGVLPVVQVGSSVVGDGAPGPMTRQILEWFTDRTQSPSP
ncbi:MAG: aminotransferase class IV [Planctomycetota bacterium]